MQGERTTPTKKMSLEVAVVGFCFHAFLFRSHDLFTVRARVLYKPQVQVELKPTASEFQQQKAEKKKQLKNQITS